MKKLLVLLIGLMAAPAAANAAVLDFSNQGDRSGPVLSYNLGGGLMLNAIGGETDDPDNGGPQASFADMFRCSRCGPKEANQVDGFGMGVGSGNIDTHSSDEDLLILSFNRMVRILSITFFQFEADNQQDPGQPDIAHLYLGDPAAQTLTHLTGFIGQDNDAAPETFGGLGFTGNDFIIGAAENGSGDSDFWLKSIEFELVDVPAPGTALLLLAGLAGLAGMRRKA